MATGDVPSSKGRRDTGDVEPAFVEKPQGTGVDEPPIYVRIIIPSSKDDQEPIVAGNGHGDLAQIPRDVECNIPLSTFRALRDAVENQLVEKTINGEKVHEYRPVQRIPFQVLGFFRKLGEEEFSPCAPPPMKKAA